MLRIFFTGGIFQFLNAVLGIFRIKYFLDVYGISAMGKVASIIAIWGLVVILTEDQRLLFRNKKINSYGIRRDLYRACRANYKFKISILLFCILVISTVDGYHLSFNQLLLAVIVITGYVLTMFTSILIGGKEASNHFNDLNLKQTLFTILNFLLFFPLIHFFSSTGFLVNAIITSNLVAVSLLQKRKKFEIDHKLLISVEQEEASITASKLYCYVLALQTSTYAFDQFLISALGSHADVVEYSLIRRIGLIMTVSTLTLSPYFSRLGTSGSSNILNLRRNMFLLSIASAIIYYALSTIIIINVLGAPPPDLAVYQLGMIALGLASINTSASISSLSGDSQIRARLHLLIRIVPIFLLISCVGISLFGGFFPLFSGALFLLLYENKVKYAHGNP